MQVNVPEMEKQRRESILKNGKYAQLEIILERGGNSPVCNISLKNVSTKDVAFLIVSMKETTKQLINLYPEAGLLSLAMEVGGQAFNKNNNKILDI